MDEKPLRQEHMRLILNASSQNAHVKATQAHMSHLFSDFSTAWIIVSQYLSWLDLTFSESTFLSDRFFFTVLISSKRAICYNIRASNFGKFLNAQGLQALQKYCRSAAIVSKVHCLVFSKPMVHLVLVLCRGDTRFQWIGNHFGWRGVSNLNFQFLFFPLRQF